MRDREGRDLPPRAHIVCWGELLWDLFPDGERLGGSSANVAYHVAALGGTARLVSRVGCDERGERARQRLTEAGVDTKLVQVDGERPTGTVRIDLHEGEPRFCIVQQTAWDQIECSEAVSTALARADALVFGTLAQRTPVGFGALRHAVTRLPKHCVRLCDINIRPPHLDRAVVDAALEAADVVKLNESEAEALRALFGVPDAERFLLEQRGIRLVALTRGDAGCRLSTREAAVEHPGFPLEDPSVGDRVGAGDAFVAVLAIGLVRGAPLEALARRANRYAGHVASRPGAMPPVPPGLLVELDR